MTWRTFSYLGTVLLAAVIVATTASSDVAISPQPSQEGSAVVASLPMNSDPIPARSSRVALLVIGIGAVAFTFRRAVLNFRQPGS